MWGTLINYLPVTIILIIAIIVCGADLIKAINVWKQEKKKRRDKLLQEAEEKRQEEIRLKEQKERQTKYRQAGLCQHCGGEIKGLFVKKCVTCGKKKDY